ncbi:hypothetical protein OL548_13860 [Lysinibacillus sp. MHQ-1]|nr:hypothetical protein OL548_13860 [Lysinibacillus sp. MHQ-1]
MKIQVTRCLLLEVCMPQTKFFIAENFSNKIVHTGADGMAANPTTTQLYEEYAWREGIL